MNAGQRASSTAPRLVLASASPRRAELLERVGYSFTVQAADVDESVLPGEVPVDYAARVAADKATAVWEPGQVVVAADTCVVLDGVALGKPVDAPDALRMLRSLAARTHSVISAVHVVGPDGTAHPFTSSALVTMAPSDPEVLAGYVAGGEPMDKAGSYALQGVGAALVAAVDGDPTTVIGLPLRETVAVLRDLGVTPPAFGA